MNGALPTEPNTVLSIARASCLHALALASSPSDRRSAVDGRGGDDGGAQGRRPWGSDRPVQAPPTFHPLCLARDALSGAVCNRPAFHGGKDHADEDDVEIRWPVGSALWGEVDE